MKMIWNNYKQLEKRKLLENDITLRLVIISFLLVMFKALPNAISIEYYICIGVVFIFSLLLQQYFYKHYGFSQTISVIILSNIISYIKGLGWFVLAALLLYISPDHSCAKFSIDILVTPIMICMIYMMAEVVISFVKWMFKL